MFEALRQVSRKDGTKRQPPTLEEVRQLNAGPGPAGDTGNGTAEVADGEEVGTNRAVNEPSRNFTVPGEGPY